MFEQNLPKGFKKILIFPIFTVSSFLTIIILVGMLLSPQFTKASGPKAIKYSIFTSKPLVLGATSARIFSEDAKAETIDRIFSEYNCPIAGYGPKFVQEAEKNNIPYWIVAAIAFQESSCGKRTPVVDGVESHNLWGYGVWGEHVYVFDSIDDGIETVSKYMSERFYQKGIHEPCEIMKVYTPPSQGSWCAGVNFFGDKIVEYKSPLE